MAKTKTFILTHPHHGFKGEDGEGNRIPYEYKKGEKIELTKEQEKALENKIVDPDSTASNNSDEVAALQAKIAELEAQNAELANASPEDEEEEEEEEEQD